MAKLKTNEYHFKSKIGDTLSFKSEVSITKDGLFHLLVPKELSNIITNLLSKKNDKHLFNFNPTTATNSKKISTDFILTGKDLISCENLIKQAGEDYVVCEIKSEFVVLYAISNTICYFKSPDNKIFPNGQSEESGYANGGKWHGSLNALHTSNAYRVGFVAVCREKITYIRESGTKIQYCKTDKKEWEYWEKLNSFCGISVVEKDMNELPYSEETAKFFYNTMLSICNLADKIELFFEDKDKVCNAIKENSMLLLK